MRLIEDTALPGCCCTAAHCSSVQDPGAASCCSSVSQVASHLSPPPVLHQRFFSTSCCPTVDWIILRAVGHLGSSLAPGHTKMLSDFHLLSQCMMHSLSWLGNSRQVCGHWSMLQGMPSQCSHCCTCKSTHNECFHACATIFVNSLVFPLMSMLITSNGADCSQATMNGRLPSTVLTSKGEPGHIQIKHSATSIDAFPDEQIKWSG